MAKTLLPGLRLLRRLGVGSLGGGFRVLLFHDIPKEHFRFFERLLEHILAVRGVITPDQAQALLSGQVPVGCQGKIPMLLTFDDGFQSQARVAEKILDKYGVKAIFFICPGLIDIPPEGQREAIAKYIFDGKHGEDLPGNLRLLSWSEAESLLASGHTIGSHTSFHRRLTGLGPEELQGEVLGSGELLEKRLGISVHWFAYPFGNIESIDPSSYELIRSHYEFSCSGIRGLNSNQTHPLALLRDCMDPMSPLDYQEFVLLGGLDFFYRRRARRLHVMAKNADGIH